jgi:hypothetical protein
MDHPLVREALARLHGGEPVSEPLKAELAHLVERLDEQYFEKADAFEAGRCGPEEYRRFFAQARAVSSIVFGVGDDALEAAMEAIYEADAVRDTDDSSELERLIETALL